MPESRKREKPKSRNKEGFVPNAPKETPQSPSWWAPVMVTLMLAGLVTLVLAYLFGGRLPIPQLYSTFLSGNGNLALGFVLVIAGFLMTLRWK